ncbi:MAG: hypothetical protein H6559_30265 [Lewinellaceae bacterium]|nr:hypothetical protein [Lewinellaceae bacterium]
MKVYLLQGLVGCCLAMSEKSVGNARKYMESLGVEVHLNTMVEEYDGQQVQAARPPSLPGT